MEDILYSLEVNDLRKTIGKRQIINGLSFQVRKGEVFGFLGPNGAGKTTTIRMIVGLTTPTGGTISVLGMNLATERAEAMKKMGAIVENPELYPFLSGLDNLKQYARMQQGITTEDIRRVVKLVGLEHRIKDKVKKYSLGMRQRLGLAQALLHRPELLILDEPTNGLDPAGIREIRNYIRRLAEEEGMSVIVSSHLLAEMELMCDRFGIIKDGQMIRIEDVQTIDTANDRVVHQFDLHPVDQAVKYLNDRQLDFDVQDKLITMTCRPSEVPGLIRELVKRDIDIYSVTKSKQSLEDRFLELTAEGGTDIA
ncbi:ABC transporter ATP-binding protein [Macrococcus equipercicus]|uniref:ABC transporter ATP-binding protein n=1 Tax=Macrococcus equipercicus TaxID=69967 RepID=A0A9Q9F0N8_9STAP|nr:ABC transporter ATP-binding protein [Macrococcus equipercicus]KAA1040021.1 ABC transporter ATP-binding protein [Macrococcus equipercicus]UTH13047.1 ABC transporter ATP-binding protein [Macrococcus equipercicus]